MYSSTSASEPICSCMNCTRSRSFAHVLDHRGLRDAERGVLGRRFHEQRRPQPSRHVDALAAPEHRELRRRDAMEGQQLLAQHLVARQQQAARIAAGVGRAHQLEERDHVLVVGDDAVEFLEQVEHHLGLPLEQRRAQLGERIEHAERSARRGRRRAASRSRRTRCATRRSPSRCSRRGCRAAPGSCAPRPAFAASSCAQRAVPGCAVQPSHQPAQHGARGRAAHRAASRARTVSVARCGRWPCAGSGAPHSDRRRCRAITAVHQSRLVRAQQRRGGQRARRRAAAREYPLQQPIGEQAAPGCAARASLPR